MFWDKLKKPKNLTKIKDPKDLTIEEFGPEVVEAWTKSQLLEWFELNYARLEKASEESDQEVAELREEAKQLLKENRELGERLDRIEASLEKQSGP